MRFVSEWLRWSLSGDLITDTLDSHRQHASFVQHRHDQSLLSILGLTLTLSLTLTLA